MSGLPGRIDARHDDTGQPGARGVGGGRCAVIAGGGDDDARRATERRRADCAAVQAILVAPGRVATLVFDVEFASEAGPGGEPWHGNEALGLAQAQVGQERRQERCPALEAGAGGPAKRSDRHAPVVEGDFQRIGDLGGAGARATADMCEVLDLTGS